MIRFTRLVAAVALLAAAGSASAFTRITTTRRHGASQAADPGLLLWWGPRSVTFHVNPEGVTSTGCTPDAAEQAVKDALTQSWPAAVRSGEASACTDFTFAPGARSASRTVGQNTENLIVFRSGFCRNLPEPAASDPCQLVDGACAVKFNCWENDVNVRGLTTTTYDTGSGEILDADVELFAWNGAQSFGAFFTCTDANISTPCSTPFVANQTGCQGTDVIQVATHESGHMLGLDHVCTTDSVSPYNACPTGRTPVMNPLVGSVANRQLAQDDVEGVCTIYPKNGPTLKSPNAGASTKSGGGGCSTGGGAGILALLGAAAAAWRARSRSVRA